MVLYRECCSSVCSNKEEDQIKILQSEVELLKSSLDFSIRDSSKDKQLLNSYRRVFRDILLIDKAIEEIGES